MGNRTLFRGGDVIDGTGASRRTGNVLVDADVIVAVLDPSVSVDDAAVVDISGQVITPGFIDLHTHYDAQLLWDPQLTPSCFHGVTTVVVGNCGFSLAPARPDRRQLALEMLRDLEDMSVATLAAGIDWSFETFGEYLDAVRRARPGLNVGAYVGHSAVRLTVMGAEAYDRDATDAELIEMRAVVRDAMADGAVGFATSCSPTGRRMPSKHATALETRSLVDEVAASGRGLASFVPGGAVDHATLYEWQPQLGIPFTWTAMLAMSDLRHHAWRAVHEAGYAAGARVHPQVSCRPLVGQFTARQPFVLRTPLMLALPDDAARLEAFADRSWQDRCRKELDELLVAVDWRAVRVVSSPRSPELEGRDLATMAADAQRHPFVVWCDLALSDGLETRFSAVMANSDEGEVASLLQLDGAVLGLSDAGAHPDQLCDAVLPTDLLGGWVRDRGVLGLEHAVHKLTGELAGVIGLTNRGVLRAGAAADLVVFDPATIGPGPVRRVRDFPADAERLTADAPHGIAHVWVNGAPVARAGRVVSGSHS
jgi:N-acyl-D-amino-acid deacylase